MISGKDILSFLVLTVNIVNIHTGAICLDVCFFITDPCEGGKTCEPKDTCSSEWNCICSATSTSPDCVNVTTTTQTQNVTEKNHSFTCPCVNGRCTTQSGTLCKCDIGWTGSRCEVEDSNIQTSYNVCKSTYKQRPRSERECYNWKCIYGICVVKDSHVFCECDPGATGQICQNKCCRQCVFGECFYVKEEEREICDCHDGYSGPYCKHKDISTLNTLHDDVNWHYWIAGACAVLFVFLITLVIVVPYILWRNFTVLIRKAIPSVQK